MEKELTARPMVIEEFIPLVGRLFRVDCEPDNVDITLVSATPVRGVTNRLRPPFTLLFQSSHLVQLTAGIYAMRCASFGPDLVYIEQTMAPIDLPHGNYYQAVFN